MSLVATPRRAPLTDKTSLWAAAPPLPFDLKSPTRSTVGRAHLVRAHTLPHTQSVSASKRSRDDEKEAICNTRAKRTRVQPTAATIVPSMNPNAASTSKTKATGTVSNPAKPSHSAISAPPALKDTEPKRPPRPTKAERLEREREIEQFKSKYIKAFPSFTFYFHSLDGPLKKTLTSKVTLLGARVEDFFSSAVTHVITNRPRPSQDYLSRLDGPNKENKGPSATKARGPTSQPLRSPIQLRTSKAIIAAPEPQVSYDAVVVKAMQFGMKVWETSKLDSIVARLVSGNHAQSLPRPTQDLSHLLAVERQQGVTQERDPNTRRHDYEYFPKNSYFLISQDMEEMHPPVALKDFGRWKKGERPGWPILNIDSICGPSGKVPPVFGWRPELDREGLCPPVVKGKIAPSGAAASKGKLDLRRSRSLHNLGRDKFKKPSPTAIARNDSLVSGGASRPSLPSQAYIAASGNSAIITSTTASTTSTAPIPSHLIHHNVLSKRLRQQVLTSRTFGKATSGPATGGDEEEASGSLTAACSERPRLIRKSKSTNTLRPPREETKKPGYCENCRVKFDDFSKHIKGRRHGRFADNVDNFSTLDEVLSRLERKTLREHQREINIVDQVLDDMSDDEEECLDTAVPGEEEVEEADEGAYPCGVDEDDDPDAEGSDEDVECAFQLEVDDSLEVGMEEDIDDF